MKTLGIATLTIITLIVSAITYGYTLHILWGWFITPTFGVHTISVVQAVGLFQVLGILRSNAKPSDTPYTEQMVEALTNAIIRPILTLGCGWVVCLFM